MPTQTRDHITPPRCAIAVMAKASRAGLTKTRLSPPLAPEEAASLNTAFLHDIADNLVAAAEIEPIAGYMAYGPPGEGRFFEFLPKGFGLFEAWCPTFGETLAHVVASLLARGHESACALNADSPTLPTAILIEAARVLAEPGDRAVLGRSIDGGYYLIGMKRMHARLFEDITWSTASVFEQTRARAAEIALPVHLLPDWYDVDDAASLAMLRSELIDGVPFDAAHRSSPATHSKALLVTQGVSRHESPRHGSPR